MNSPVGRIKRNQEAQVWAFMNHHQQQINTVTCISDSSRNYRDSAIRGFEIEIVRVDIPGKRSCGVSDTIQCQDYGPPQKH